MKEYLFTVEEKFNNFKAVDYLKAIGISQEIIVKIKFGYIYVNGQKLLNVNNPLKSGDRLKIVMPIGDINPYIKPIKSSLEILYEDEYFLAVVKPKNMLTHSLKHNESIALDQIVCGYFLPNDFTFRAVNRLDKDTSGIILVAKDMLSASFLGRMLKNGEIKKRYSAVVCGVPKEEHFFIEKPIKRQSESIIKRVCDKDGKYAKTECFLVKKLDNDLSLLDIVLHTGRTHQIRVHLSSIGHPLYADSLYGKAVEGETYTLQANELEFIHPFTKVKMTLKMKQSL